MPIPALLASAAPYAIGGLAGLIGSLFNKGGQQQGQGGIFQGIPAQTKQLPLYSQPQQQLQNQSIQQALALLQGKGGGDQFFGPIEQRARSQFQTQTIPSIAERFTSLGSGAQNSSAFQGALGQAGAGLEESLSAMRGQGQLGLLRTLLGVGMAPQFENIYNPRSPGLLELGAGGLASGVGQALPLMAFLSMLGGQQQGSDSEIQGQRQNRLGGGFGLGTAGEPGSFNLPTARQALLRGVY